MLASGQYLFGQSVGNMTHYQRKMTADTLLVPCDRFSSELFKIEFPDSFYDAGSVLVKKLEFKGISGFYYFLTFKDNQVLRITLKARGKKRKAMLFEFETKALARYQASSTCKPVSTITESGRKAILTIQMHSDK